MELYGCDEVAVRESMQTLCPRHMPQTNLCIVESVAVCEFEQHRTFGVVWSTHGGWCCVYVCGLLREEVRVCVSHRLIDGCREEEVIHVP